MPVFVYERAESEGSYTKMPVFVYERAESEGSYTKKADFVYGRGESESSYTKKADFVYESPGRKGKNGTKGNRDGRNNGEHCRFGKIRYLCRL